MSAFVWVMMGIAVWHFTVFVPDKFWGGIVGAFLVAMVGAFVFGVLVNGLDVPGRNDTHLIQALVAIPGAVIALALSWLYGKRAEEHGPRRRKKGRGRPAPRPGRA